MLALLLELIAEMTSSFSLLRGMFSRQISTPGSDLNHDM
jgi:hypothetical protein